MVVNFSFTVIPGRHNYYWFRRDRKKNMLFLPEVIHVRVKQNLQKGDEEVEDEPHLDHLHVRGEGERGRDWVQGRVRGAYSL